MTSVPQPGTSASLTPPRVAPSTNQTVQVAAGVSGEDLPIVVKGLQAYFDSINQQDYDEWLAAVGPTLAKRHTRDDWQQAYAGVTDSSITLLGYSQDPLQAAVRFVAVDEMTDQRPAGTTCVVWTLTFRLANIDGRYAVDSTVDDSIIKTSCD